MKSVRICFRNIPSTRNIILNLPLMQPLSAKVTNPYGFALYDDTIFWTENLKGMVRSYSFTTNEERTLIFENSALYDLKVFSSESQKCKVFRRSSRFKIEQCDIIEYDNPILSVLSLNEIWCLKANICHGLCVPSPEVAKCLCADGMNLEDCVKSPENDTYSYCGRSKVL